MNKAKAFFSTLLDALYPKGCVCMLCNKESVVGPDELCGDCRKSLRYCPDRACPPPLSGAVSALLYEGGVKEAIHRFKYQKCLYYAPFFAGYLSVPADWSVQRIVPVPLHKNKLKQRGYNQSALLAKALAKKLYLPCDEGKLIRIRDTESQTGLSAAERAKNVKGAFAVTDDITGEQILLVDDVSTTGATLSACADALLSAGAERVYAVCAAGAAHPL